MTNKFARNETSPAILDLVFSACIFDLAFLYNWGGLYTVTSKVTAAYSTDLASSLETVMNTAEADLSKTLDALEIEH